MRFQRRRNLVCDLETCYIFVKNVATFCLVQKVCLRLKSLELIALVKGISKQPNIDSVMQLLVVTLEKIYDEKEEA